MPTNSLPLVFCDSFDHYNTVNELGQKWTGSQFINFPVAGRNGNGISLQGSSNGQLWVTLGPSAEYLVGFAMNWAGYGGGPYLTYAIFQVYDSLNVSYAPFSFGIAEDGNLALQTLQGTVEYGGPGGGGVITQGIWNFIEVAFALTGKPGKLGAVEAEAWVNGIFFGLQGLSTQIVPLMGIPPAIDTIKFFGPANAFNSTVFDDIYIADSGNIPTVEQNAGDCKILVYFPDANTTLNQWLNQANLTADFSDINSNPPNDSKYISAMEPAMDGDVSLFGFQSITGSTQYLTGMVIPAVQSVLRYESLGDKVNVLAGPSVTDFSLSAPITTAGVFFFLLQPWQVEPVSMNPWTAGLFNLELFGVKEHT